MKRVLVPLVLVLLVVLLSQPAYAAVAVRVVRHSSSSGTNADIVYNPSANVTVYGNATLTLIVSDYLPVFKLDFNITSGSISYKAYTSECPVICVSGYHTNIKTQRYYAGVKVTYMIYGDKGQEIVYTVIVAPWTMITENGDYKAVIDYIVRLERVVGSLPRLATRVYVAYSRSFVLNYTVTPSIPDVDYTYYGGSPLLRYWHRRDVAGVDVLWPILINYTGLAIVGTEYKYVVNGTHAKLEIQLPEYKSFVIRVGYASGEYTRVELDCLYGCDEKCQRYMAIVEVYNASDNSFIGIAGVTSYCPNRYVVYVRIPYDLLFRVVVLEDGKPIYASIVSVAKPRTYTPLLQIILSVVIIGGVLAGVFRRSLREAAASLIAGSVILYFASPYLGAYSYHQLYIYLAAAGLLTLIIVLVRGE